MGKRNDTGITSRSKGSITVQFYWNGINCRETLKLEPTKQNLLYVARLRSEILRKITLGTFNYAEYFPNSPRAGLEKAKIPSFKELAENWLKIIKANQALSTYNTYRKYIDKYWNPKFGDLRIDKILPSEISTTLALIEVSPKTRNNILITIRGPLGLAFHDGVIQSDPTARIENVKFQNPEPDPLTLDEANTLLEFMAARYDEQVINYFEFAIFSGLRTAEQIELYWGDVERDEITIRRSRVENTVKATKTYKTRQVALNDRAKAALKRQEKFTKMKGDHVFNNPVTGLPWNDQRSQSKNYWHPALKACHLRERDPYQTRHTYATMMLMMGANPMWVAKQMGHKNMKMLLEIYARWIDKADKSKEIEKVNNQLLSTNYAHKKISNS
jgi:integrase